MNKARFVPAKVNSNTHWYGTTSENKRLSQREKLEEAILNLATALGIEEVERVELAERAGTQYAVPPKLLQSASNTIVTLSQMVLERAKGGL